MHLLAPEKPITSKTPAMLRQIKGHFHETRLKEWAGVLLGNAPDSFFHDHQIETIVKFVTESFKLIRVRKAGKRLLRVSGRIIMLMQDDRPFLVRSLRELLRQNHVGIRLILHPVISTRRRKDGRLEPGIVAKQDGARNESFILVETTDEPPSDIAGKINRLMDEVSVIVSDFERMHEKLSAARESLDFYHGLVRESERDEAAAFFDWLAAGHLVLLGYREYDLTSRHGVPMFGVRHKSGLGIFSDERASRFYQPMSLAKLDKEARSTIMSGPLLVISKTNALTSIYRGGRMDYIALKKIDSAGKITGEHRFLGLFSDKANYVSKIDVPILRNKYEQIREAFRATEGSFDDREIVHLFSAQQIDTLLLTKVEDLAREFELIIRGFSSDDVRTALRYDAVRRGIVLTLVMSQSRYRASMRDQVIDLITPLVGATDVDTRMIADSGEGGIVRMEFYFSTPTGSSGEKQDWDATKLTPLIEAAVRTWKQRLHDTLVMRHAERGDELFRKYSDALNEAYQVIVEPALAADDIAALDSLISAKGHTLVCWGRPSPEFGASYIKIFNSSRRLAISEIAPILVNHGFTVDEENSFPLEVGEATPECPAPLIYLHVFRLKTETGAVIVEDERGRITAESILSSFEGRMHHDTLCSLVVSTDLTLEEIELLRCIRNYARQVGAIVTRQSVNNTLLGHLKAVRIFIDLFGARFDPERASEGKYKAAKKHFETYLADVTSLDDDRSLRAFFNVIDATVRTNYYLERLPNPEEDRPIAIKIDCSKITRMVSPRPWREIYVYGGASMEGCHLRGGPVARGGIRWSERPDDFRTEILGLMKTQVTKNAQIVPTGAKGGFIAKRSVSDRTEMAAEIKRCYKLLISSLLDIQDNVDRSSKSIIRPVRVVAHDGDDPYLVVAADKGTATFSDTANALSRGYGFWLDDAFASGGSNGYDHKKEGITARGAWVSVMRHFRDAGKNIEHEPFTAVGIGDMSGDVFGNGMLLSNKIKLIAAFDHRDIFLDPDPDPRVSLAERKRLFNLPRSSWSDYDRKKISRGGGIFARTLKSIPLSEPVRRALGMHGSGHSSSDARALDPDSLIRAILSAPVDLLYNGGIGTYVKASHESNADVGDTQSELVRIDAIQLRCAVVAEGGNLGFTQGARIEYALKGGRIFTDAIDNSAGVDLSDHEVNLKILIDGAALKKSSRERSRLLATYKDAVITDVLRDNDNQTLAVSLDEIRSRRRLSIFAAALADMERRGLLNASLEGLPDVDTLRDRAASGAGLTRPELAVMLSYAKLDVKARLLDSPLISRPHMDKFTELYFAPDVRRRFAGEIPRHGLRDNILVTVLSNLVINFHGATALHKLTTELGLATSRVVESLLIARDILEVDTLMGSLFKTGSEVAASQQYDELLLAEESVVLTARWLIRNIRDLRGRMSDGLTEYRGLSARFLPLMPKILPDTEKKAMESSRRARIEAGLSEDCARRLGLFEQMPTLMDVIHLATSKKMPLASSGSLLYDIGSRLRLDYLIMLITRIKSMTTRSDWEGSAAADVIAELRQSRRRIAARMMDLGGDFDDYLKQRFRSFETLQSAISRIESEEPTSIAPFIVISNQIRNLASL